MHQALHLQNTGSLFEPNVILKHTDSAFKHSQGTGTEWFYLAFSEKQKPPHKGTRLQGKSNSDGMSCS